MVASASHSNQPDELFRLVVRNSTITGNTGLGYSPYVTRGGGIVASSLDIANSIVAGNVLVGTGAIGDPDISGTITFSNGHNIFGSDVAGNVAGDRENMAPGAVFAALDPDTGGGLLNPNGVVSLLNSITNPALSGADPLAASATGQLGTSPRPLPAGSLPDIGSIEINQPLSTTTSANNDVITGNGAANTLNGDLRQRLSQGPGRQRHAQWRRRLRPARRRRRQRQAQWRQRRRSGLLFRHRPRSRSTSASPPTTPSAAARPTRSPISRGRSAPAPRDTFKGDQFNNYFQGGLGKDKFTGG